MRRKERNNREEERRENGGSRKGNVTGLQVASGATLVGGCRPSVSIKVTSFLFFVDVRWCELYSASKSSRSSPSIVLIVLFCVPGLQNRRSTRGLWRRLWGQLSLLMTAPPSPLRSNRRRLVGCHRAFRCQIILTRAGAV